MTKYIGYIGVVTVTVSEERYYDDESYDTGITIAGEDPAHEVPGFEIHYNGGFMGAWRKAARLIREHGGVVAERPPCRPRVKHLTKEDRFPGWDGDTGVHTCPWGYPMEFRSRKEAKKYAKRNREAINNAWDY